MAVASSLEGRAAAILTTGEVYGADLDLQSCLDGKVAVDFSFTLGDLTSATVKAYAGPAATPTDPLWINGTKQEMTLTANTEACLVFDCAGARYFRLSIQGTGSVTSSTCNYTYRYLDYETSSRQDGHVRVG